MLLGSLLCAAAASCCFRFNSEYHLPSLPFTWREDRNSKGGWSPTRMAAHVCNIRKSRAAGQVHRKAAGLFWETGNLGQGHQYRSIQGLIKNECFCKTAALIFQWWIQLALSHSDVSRVFPMLPTGLYRFVARSVLQLDYNRQTKIVKLFFFLPYSNVFPSARVRHLTLPLIHCGCCVTFGPLPLACEKPKTAAFSFQPACRSSSLSFYSW